MIRITDIELPGTKSNRKSPSSRESSMGYVRVDPTSLLGELRQVFLLREDDG